MTNSTTIDISSTLTQRFYRYLIDLKFALRAEDFDDGLTVDIDAPKDDKNFQSQPTERILLDVEKKRVEREKLKQESETRSINEMSNWIHPRIYQDAQEKLLDIDHVQQSLLRLSINFNDLMDVLYSPAMTYSRVASVVSARYSLEKTLLQMVNQASFQKQIGRSVSRRIKDSQIAISLLGATGAKALLPTMVIKQCVKLQNEHFPLLGFKLWKHMLATGLATHYLLQKEGYKDPVEGLLAGSLVHLGKVAAYHQFLNSFDEVKTHFLKDFRQRGKKHFHDYLLMVEPESAVPFELFKTSTQTIPLKLANHMSFQKHRPAGLINTLEQFCLDVPFEECGPVAKAMHQASIYSIIEQMRQAKLINKQELGAVLEQVDLDESTFKEMTLKNLTRMNFRTFVE